jgi:hypothetical protein
MGSRTTYLATAAVLASLPLAVAARADGGLRVLILPAGPGSEPAAADAHAALTSAGHDVIAPAPLAAHLAALGEAARADEAALLDRVQAGIAEVRQAYVEQRFDDMLARLGAIERDALVTLGQPAHATTLWELQFWWGLGHLVRRGPEDAARSRDRFELALAIDADRRPPRDLFGPDVAAAFTSAADARSRKTPRPITFAVSPPDAAIIVDGVPVVDPARPRSVRRGWHVVRASAIGHVSEARVIRIDDERRVEMTLTAAAGDAVDRIGAAWADGLLRADSASMRAAVRALAAQLGAAVALIIADDPQRGEVVAQLVTTTDAGPLLRRRAAAAAAAAVLAHLRPDGTLAEPSLPTDREPAAPGRKPGLLSRWWFWAGVGAVAVATLAVGLAASDEPDRLRVVGPRP